jgi:hypothetical protein
MGIVSVLRISSRLLPAHDPESESALCSKYTALFHLSDWCSCNSLDLPSGDARLRSRSSYPIFLHSCGLTQFVPRSIEYGIEFDPGPASHSYIGLRDKAPYEECLCGFHLKLFDVLIRKRELNE